MLQSVKGNIWLPLAFVVVLALSRIPGMLPENFSAIYAVMFCAGVYLPGRVAWWLPLTTIVFTDICLNFYYQLALGWEVWTPPALISHLFNYGAYVALILLGRCFKPKASGWSLVGGGVLGALLFYLITNFAAWLFNPFKNPEYNLSLASLLLALTKGTGGWPDTWQFLRNTLLSGGLFTALFVIAAKLTAQESPQDKLAGAPADEQPDAAPEPAPEEARA